ncbi:MAG: Fic family protein [Verrucomicrobiales bacterium]|jgi:Fic family protein
MRERLTAEPEIDVYDREFICWLHAEFYSLIPEEDWVTTSEDGTRYPNVPGVLREYNVTVGRHVPPNHPALPSFMARFKDFYSGKTILPTQRLIALAAAHHRLVWIHPFGDGNGRVARLQSQAAMIRAGLDSDGLWTFSRGLARRKQDYYRLLQAADRHRRNDFDGRGNLSDRELTGFCRV